MIIKKIKTVFKFQAALIFCFVVNANAETANHDYDHGYRVFEYYLSFLNSTAAPANNSVVFTSNTREEPIVALPPQPTPTPPVPGNFNPSETREPTPAGPPAVEPTPPAPGNFTPPETREPTPAGPPEVGPTPLPDDGGPTPVIPDDDGTTPLPPTEEPTPLPDGWTPPTPVEPEPPTPPVPTYQECNQAANDDYTTCQTNAYRDRQRLLPDTSMEQTNLRNIQMLNQLSLCENDRINQQLICYCSYFTDMMPNASGCNYEDISRTVCINTAYTNYNNCQRLANTGPAAKACEDMKVEDLANCEDL